MRQRERHFLTKCQPSSETMRHTTQLTTNHYQEVARHMPLRLVTNSMTLNDLELTQCVVFVVLETPVNFRTIQRRAVFQALPTCYSHVQFEFIVHFANTTVDKLYTVSRNFSRGYTNHFRRLHTRVSKSSGTSYTCESCITLIASLTCFKQTFHT